VETRSVLANFHSFHHLFFVICKLLKGVVAQNPSVAQPAKPSEGGFLRQPYSSAPISPQEHVVDIANWEKFCTSLSATIWPFIFTCLGEGDALICTKQCQVHLYSCNFISLASLYILIIVVSTSSLLSIFCFRYHVFVCLSCFLWSMSGSIRTVMQNHAVP
jgi:hypothetical protein